MENIDLPHQAVDERNGGAKLAKREQARAQAVVDVMGVIGDIVSDCSRLGLEARMQAEVETLYSIVAQDRGRDAAGAVSLGRRAVCIEERPVMLDQPGQRRLGQIEAVEGGVAALELGHDAQGMAVVVEAAVLDHAGVKRVLPGVPKRRVAEVVGERDRFGEVVVEPQGAGERARDLRHLDRVGEAGAEMVALVIDEHLGLVGEPAESGRMNDPVAVALEFGPRRRRRLGNQTRRARRIGGVGRANLEASVVRRSVP